MGEARSAWCLRRDGRDLVVAVDARDFFDEVLGPREVRAPAGHGDGQGRLPVNRVVDLASHRGESVLYLLTRVVDTHALGGSVGEEWDHGRFRDRPDDSHLGRDGTPGKFVDQLCTTHGGGRPQVWVNSAFEAAGGFAGQFVATCGASDRHLVEVGGFNDDRGGCFADLGVLPAHDAGQPDDALTIVGFVEVLFRVPGGGSGVVVGDEQVFGVEFALNVVQSGELFPGASATHRDFGAELVCVIGVEWLAQFQHDVVGDVNDQGEWSHAGFQEAFLHPVRACTLCIDSVHAHGGET